MNRSNAVMFRGINAVVKAYELNDIAPFAVIHDKDLICRCDLIEGKLLKDCSDGAEMLRSFLKSLQEGGSEATYRLAVYELKVGEKITPKTEPTCSFKFSLFDAQELTPYNVARAGFAQNVQSQLDEMKELILSMKAEEPQEPKEQSAIGSLLNGLMGNEDFKQAIAMKAIGFMDSILPGKKLFPQQQPAAIGQAEPQSVETGQSLLTQEQADKVNQALNILCTKDPHLGDNLMKLAKLIQENPMKYKMAATML